VSLVAATRELSEVTLAASPRASLALMKVSQAMSLMEGKDFVTPDIIQANAVEVIAHRLVLDADAQYSGKSAASLIQGLLEKTPVPA